MIFTLQHFKEKITEDMNSPYHWIYRGHSDVTWTLTSSFSRFCQKNEIQFSLSTFFKLLHSFIDQASDYQAKDLRGIHIYEKIAFAQHHGVPTPFIDWTESPYIAAFFAVLERLMSPTDSPFRVWALQVNESDYADASFSEEDLLVRPFHVVRTKLFQSKRLSRQLGCFTYLGLDKDLEYYYKNENKGARVKFYDVSGENWLWLLRELHLMGISSGTLFDSLDGLARDIILEGLASR